MKTHRMIVLAGLALALATGWLGGTPTAADGAELLAYFGTNTGSGKSKGIYCYRFDLASGKLTPVGVTEGIKNPTFLTIHPSGKYLYAVSEVTDASGKAGGAV